MKKDRGKVLMLLVIRLKKGLNNGDEMFLVAIKEVQVDALGVVLEALAPILKDFIGMMLI